MLMMECAAFGSVWKVIFIAYNLFATIGFRSDMDSKSSMAFKFVKMSKILPSVTIDIVYGHLNY